MVRTSELILIELATLAREFLFYLSDLVRFDAPDHFKTFLDISPANLITLLYQWVSCLTSFLDLLDSDECLSNNAPFGLPPLNANSSLPPKQPLFPPPNRWQYDCPMDSLARHMFGNTYIYQNIGSTANQALYCNVSNINNGCMNGTGVQDGSLYTFKFNGSLPDIATNYAFTFPSVPNYGTYGIWAVDGPNACANYPSALSDPLPPTVGCSITTTSDPDDHMINTPYYKPLEQNVADFTRVYYQNVYSVNITYGNPLLLEQPGDFDIDTCDYGYPAWLASRVLGWVIISVSTIPSMVQRWMSCI